MNVTVFGAGYVGLVQAAVLADIGHDVVVVDVNEKRVAQLLAGSVPVFEPGLDRLVAEGRGKGRLRFTTEAADGIAHAQVQFVAVGTPPRPDGSADLSGVMAVADAVASHATDFRLVVLKSTVAVGTADKVSARLAEGLGARGRGTVRCEVASNPEFLKEGSAVADCAKPDRIIIGTSTKRSEDILRELYAPLNRNHEKIIAMDVRSAELTKYAANAMLATKISFMNEMANLADRLGADIESVRRGVGSDPRIGYDFIYPGLGFGGSCFPKDLRALIHTAQTLDFDAAILKAVLHRNERQKLFLLDKIVDRFGPSLRGRTFALWGLAFKPNTDDIRESPACALMESLLAGGAGVRAYDPKAMDRCRQVYGHQQNLTFVDSQDEALVGADALVVATEWRSFQSLDYRHLHGVMKSPVVFDGRNIYDPAVAQKYGFEIVGIGRSSSPPGDAPRPQDKAAWS